MLAKHANCPIQFPGSRFGFVDMVNRSLLAGVVSDERFKEPWTRLFRLVNRQFVEIGLQEIQAFRPQDGLQIDLRQSNSGAVR